MNDQIRSLKCDSYIYLIFIWFFLFIKSLIFLLNFLNFLFTLANSYVCANSAMIANCYHHTGNDHLTANLSKTGQLFFMKHNAASSSTANSTRRCSRAWEVKQRQSCGESEWATTATDRQRRRSIPRRRTRWLTKSALVRYWFVAR